MIYKNNGKYQFIDLNLGTWLSPTWCDTATGAFKGWIWKECPCCGKKDWTEVSGVFAFDVLQGKVVIDKARP